VKQYLKLPLHCFRHVGAIEYATQQNGRIQVNANVQVTKVIITISDEEGNSVEKGQLTSLYGDFWEYVTSTKGNVMVEAFDLAGNCTRHEA
jgi:hypothetical protein